MLAWEISSVAMLAAVLLMATWLLRRRKAGGKLPGLRRTARAGGCAARGAQPSRFRRQGPLRIRPLPSALRAQYTGAFRSAEAAFPTAPEVALHKLDQVAGDILRHCGYPVDTFEHDVATILSSAPRVVEDYRTAHSIAVANDNGMASEPDLRLAMFHYRSLLKTLLEDDGPGRLAESPR